MVSPELLELQGKEIRLGFYKAIFQRNGKVKGEIEQIVGRLKHKRRAPHLVLQIANSLLCFTRILIRSFFDLGPVILIQPLAVVVQIRNREWVEVVIIGRLSFHVHPYFA